MGNLKRRRPAENADSDESGLAREDASSTVETPPPAKKPKSPSHATADADARDWAPAPAADVDAERLWRTELYPLAHTGIAPRPPFTANGGPSGHSASVPLLRAVPLSTLPAQSSDGGSPSRSSSAEGDVDEGDVDGSGGDETDSSDEPELDEKEVFLLMRTVPTLVWDDAVAIQRVVESGCGHRMQKWLEREGMDGMVKKLAMMFVCSQRTAEEKEIAELRMQLAEKTRELAEGASSREQERAAMEKQIADMRTQLAASQEECEEKTTRAEGLSFLQGELKEVLRTNADESRKTLMAWREEVAALQETMGKEKEVHRSTQDQLREAREEIERLRAAQTAVEEAAEEVAAIREELNKYIAAHAAAQMELTALHSEQQAASTRTAQLKDAMLYVPRLMIFLVDIVGKTASYLHGREQIETMPEWL